MYSHDPALTRLTKEQLVAIACEQDLVYIEAAPGSGKTTVAAQRFGLLRFSSPIDRRATIALSFTKSATRELRTRVRASWGDVAVGWPHRITTLDELLKQLLQHLLDAELLSWPQGNGPLSVIDSWKCRAAFGWRKELPILVVVDRRVEIRVQRLAEPASRVLVSDYRQNINERVCTHDDVRAVLNSCFQDAGLLAVLAERLRQMARAIIVDEVFDANPLDLRLIELAASQGLSVTIVGDPWQALYTFRGAGPHLVPRLVDRLAFTMVPLSNSFRFQSAEMVCIAHRLRRRAPVSLGTSPPEGVDVVLASKWKSLWLSNIRVLPLSFGTPNGAPAAAAILLLNHVTTLLLGQEAVYVEDALFTLGLTRQQLSTIDPTLGELLEALVNKGEAQARQAFLTLRAKIEEHSAAKFPRIHASHVERLKWLAGRLSAASGPLVPALTIHQAKGREWDRVGIVLTNAELEALSNGLDPSRESHRLLYVGLTRARLAALRLSPIGL